MIENKEPPSSWISLKEAIVLFAFIFIMIAITVTILSVIIDPWPQIWRFYILMLWQSLVIVGVIGLVFFSRQLSLKDLGLDLSGFFRGIGTGINWGAGIFVGVFITGMLLQFLGPLSPKQQDFAEVVLASRQPAELWAGILIGVVLAPLAEELLFRGMLFPAMREKMGLTTAVILNGAFFAAVHMDALRFLPLAVGGMLLAWLFGRTGNLYVAIAAHSTWNALMLAMLLLA